MHEPNSLFILSLHMSSTALLGYVGLGPGPEFITYFLALVGVAGAALVAVLQWPILALRAYFRRKRGENEAELQSVVADPSQMQGDANDDRPGP